jgi:aminoglycoside phosphotransferase (APT) family kinase protein
LRVACPPRASGDGRNVSSAFSRDPARGAAPGCDDALDVINLGAYLRALGIAPPDVHIKVTPLSGGISNTVLRAAWADRVIVVKQSLPRLRVEADWEFDRARIFVERECMETLTELLPGTAPDVVFSDEARFVFGMTALPAGGVVWKDAHLAGRLDAARTTAAAELLARLQLATAGNSLVAARFDDVMPLLQGRIHPYHRTAAAAHPELARLIEDEIQRMLATRTVLVHGDFSPKNLVAYGDRMMMLDFEVAHWGDPAFDVAFLISHLILGSCYHEQLADRFIDEAVRFWRAYRTASEGLVSDEASVVCELACLLLARIDGKSPVEYLTRERERDAVRRYAITLLRDDGCRDVESSLDRARTILRVEGVA